MTHKQFWAVIALAGVAAFGGVGVQAGIVSTYTGGDVGEGLDLDTTLGFAYAVNGNGPVTTVRGAAFTVAETTPGFTHNTGSGYGMVVNYGPSPDDIALGLTASGRYNLYPATVDLAFANLTPGTTYKLQLLFHEPGAAPTGRLLDVTVEGALSATINFNATGSLSTNGIGVVVTDFYTATVSDTTLNVHLAVANATDNPFYSAATLEILPEPASLCLLALGGLALLRRRN